MLIAELCVCLKLRVNMHRHTKENYFVTVRIALVSETSDVSLGVVLAEPATNLVLLAYTDLHLVPAFAQR